MVNSSDKKSRRNFTDITIDYLMPPVYGFIGVVGFFTSEKLWPDKILYSVLIVLFLSWLGFMIKELSKKLKHRAKIKEVKNES